MGGGGGGGGVMDESTLKIVQPCPDDTTWTWAKVTPTSFAEELGDGWRIGKQCWCWPSIICVCVFGVCLSEATSFVQVPSGDESWYVHFQLFMPVLKSWLCGRSRGTSYLAVGWISSSKLATIP